jgi:hypothetical protein
MPIYPDTSAFGQANLSPHGIWSDGTLRPQAVPSEISEAGGFCVGLEVAYTIPDDQLQPLGPIIAFVVTPIGQDRSEVRIFFPLGISIEERDARQRVVEEFKRAWPDAPMYGDEMPWWFVRDFNRRELFAAIATRSPAPPDAPPRRPRGSPRPWREQPTIGRRPSAEVIDNDSRLSSQDKQMIRMWALEHKTGPQIANIVGLSKSRVSNRLSELRKLLGEDIVPNRGKRQRMPGS